MMPTNSSSEDGFSILEMIVAMTILALVLGIASQTIVLASRSIVTAREQVEAARKIRAIMAEYNGEAGTEGAAKMDGIAQSGWTLKAYPVDVAKAKMSAVVIEKSGAGTSGSFLTFLPARQQNPQ
ncbi:type II secretion system protein J [Mesorhizobium sp. INR15]|uniref:PulJ/GspJ family protein n=1 Tax=Mesorhizobium sp. INR15 TaxID=2654248 RepID=UPI0018964A61|nr:prepilin-type N-terminal cleavage/methylation domain-containing protein [Mesorhizobium sp. INR15]QPC90766.1 prepilin-type N-terminal cleavage/methylation domain-containing protein [Mesorhizobium sp. INR15]